MIFVLPIKGKHKEIETNFFEEKAALEAKYQKLYEPFYKKVSVFSVFSGCSKLKASYNLLISCFSKQLLNFQALLYIVIFIKKLGPID